jgi:hypothetical protein
MRQGQQHRRGRSRGGNSSHNSGSSSNNNNNRKGQNPLTRNYQSNGPDGKVSGTPSSIAEKYLSQARDAMTSGDPVMAENFLQHAEHYNRIILAHRETQAQGEEGRQRPGQTEGADGDDQGEDDVENYGRDMQPLPPVEVAPPRQQDQPRVFDRTDGNRSDGNRADANRPDGNRDGQRDGNRFEQQPRFNDQQRRPQRDRFEPRERYGADGRSQEGRNNNQERFNTGDRNTGDRPQHDRGNGQDRPNGDRFNGQPRGDRFQGDRQPSGDRFQGNRDRTQNDRNMGDRNQGERFQPDRGTEPRGLPPSGLPGPASVGPGAATTGDPTPPDQGAQGRQPVLERGFMQPRLDVPPPVRERSVEAAAPMPRFETPVPVGMDQPILASEPVARAPRAPRRERAATPVAEHEQPEFLRRPVRRPKREATATDEAAPAAVPVPIKPNGEPGAE